MLQPSTSYVQRRCTHCKNLIVAPSWNSLSSPTLVAGNQAIIINDCFIYKEILTCKVSSHPSQTYSCQAPQMLLQVCFGPLTHTLIAYSVPLQTIWLTKHYFQNTDIYQPSMIRIWNRKNALMKFAIATTLVTYR